MKKAVPILLLAALALSSLAESIGANSDPESKLIAQSKEEENKEGGLGPEGGKNEELPLEERNAVSAAVKADLEAQKQKDFEALREAAADTTEYTLRPTSVELVVELDPNG